MSEKLTTKIYNNYQTLLDKAWLRGKARIIFADNRLGDSTTMLCCHNWGNDKAKLELARYEHFTSYLMNRRDREYDRALHLEHIKENKIGEYLWCQYCKA